MPISAGTGGYGGVLYNLPGLMDAVAQIAQAAQQTDQNHTASVNVLTQSPDVFGGQGHAAFSHNLLLVNQAYNMSQDAIAQAGYALNMATDGMRETDAQLAAQYMGGTGLY
jgi:uncharacterized protein YukE